MDQYPTQKEQESWIRWAMESPTTSSRMYVKTYLEQQQLQQENNESSACPPPPLQVEESHIMREVMVFSLASHMVWCLWGLKQVGARRPGV